MAGKDGAGALGARFAIGVGLIILGYGALAFIPVVAKSGLSLPVKTTISSILAVTPLLSKFAAVAVMGKPGFNYLKELVMGKMKPKQTVSPGRYRFGIILLIIAFGFDQVVNYLPGLVIDWSANKILWSLVPDGLFIVSLFILGGDFWDKLRALFSYSAKVSFPKD